MKSCLRSSKDRMPREQYRASPLHTTLSAPFQKIVSLVAPHCFCSGRCHPLLPTHGCEVSTQNIFPFHPSSSGWTQWPISNIPCHRLPTRVPPSCCTKKTATSPILFEPRTLRRTTFDAGAKKPTTSHRPDQLWIKLCGCISAASGSSLHRCHFSVLGSFSASTCYSDGSGRYKNSAEQRG